MRAATPSPSGLGTNGIDGRLKPGGKYEMATMELLEDVEISVATVRRLTREAAKLNKTLGDPTDI